jgi:hypothetical protein
MIQEGILSRTVLRNLPLVFHQGKKEKKEKLFFGIELEIEYDDCVPDTDRQYINYCPDGSISEGFECVSMPMTYQFLKETGLDIWKREVLNLRKSGALSYNTDTCGMHVHLSRKAFSTFHLAKFMLFFQNNHHLIRKVARRKDHTFRQWCKFYENTKAVCRAIKSYTDRFMCVNVTNRITIEVRIFRGTLIESSFRRNVEFCHAAFHFTKMTALKDVTEDNFRRFVSEYKKEYPNLAEYLPVLQAQTKALAA